MLAECGGISSTLSKCWPSVEVCPAPSVNAGRVWRPACTSAFGWQRRGPLSKLTSWTSIGQLVQLVQTLPLNKVKRAPNVSLWPTQHLHTHHRHYTCRKTENRQLPPPLVMEGYSPRHAWHLSSECLMLQPWSLRLSTCA